MKTFHEIEYTDQKEISAEDFFKADTIILNPISFLYELELPSAWSLDKVLVKEFKVGIQVGETWQIVFKNISNNHACLIFNDCFSGLRLSKYFIYAGESVIFKYRKISLKPQFELIF
jgi:hypothetical protein